MDALLSEEGTMKKSEALAKIYEEYTEEQLRYAKDEPDAEIVERFIGARGFSADTYHRIQREFGWDDTH